MDSVEFAARRAEALAAGDEMLRPAVGSALQQYADGEADWADGIIQTASQVWIENYQAEAPGRPYARPLARFQQSLADSLEKTTQPDGEPSDGQIDRITHWLSTYATNAGTITGAFGAGVRFKRWVSMRDDAVREAHQDADGQLRPIGGTFDVAGVKLGYPGEPVGPPEVWINCRCVLQPASRQGGTMTFNTYQIGPDDSVEDNPDVEVGYDAFMVQRDWAGGTDYYGPFTGYAAASTFTAGDGEYGVIGLQSTHTLGDAGRVAYAVADPSDIAVQPLDEDDLADDELEDDEELITEMPVHGVIAPEGIPTGDTRKFDIGALTARNLPLPLQYEFESSHGGGNSRTVTVGRIDEAWRDDATDMWRYRGAIVLDKPYAPEVVAGIIDGTIRGVSLDGDMPKIEVPSGDEEISLEQLLNPDDTVYTATRIAGLTIVPIPAFQEAYIGLGHDFTEDLSQDDLAALTACGCLTGHAEETEQFKDYDAAARRRMAESGQAMDDGSFPIADEEDLRNAIQSIGRAADPKAAKAHIKRRAAALGASDLIPDDWSLLNELLEEADRELATFAPGTKDGPGWITHPVPTARIRRYWVSGKGAAKIRWGAPGDFNRCRKQLAKYVQNPEWLAGLCANMHYEALGIWPATHGADKPHALDGITASAAISQPVRYPAEWFANPGLDHAAPFRIDGQRIFGYLAQWGVCHIGITGMCRDVPRSRSGYGYFLKGVVDTDAGTQRVGTLTYGIGHASPSLRAAAASAHYDQTDAVRAFVNVGEDAHGIWFAGVLAPWTTEQDVAALRAIGALSGDWRNWTGLPEDYELVGAVAVAVPGYQLAASGAIGLGYLTASEVATPALVAAGSASAPVDAELVGAIARTAVAEYRHQEKVATTLAPIRQSIRASRLAAVRARIEGGQ